MKLFVLDGCTRNNDKIKNGITEYYENNGYEVNWFKAIDKEIDYCVGCWTCWMKTPGVCIHKDNTPELLSGIINSDLFIHVTENSLGFMTSLSKKAYDKMVALIHPYIEIVNDECHHRKRYDEIPKMGLVFIDNESDDKDFKLLDKIAKRQCLNFRTDHVFSIKVTDQEEVDYERLYI